MPVTSVTTDPEALTLTMVADFPVAPERVWKAFTDPRQLERFWGPPGWPATFPALSRTQYQFSSAMPSGSISSRWAKRWAKRWGLRSQRRTQRRTQRRSRRRCSSTCPAGWSTSPRRSIRSRA